MFAQEHLRLEIHQPRWRLQLRSDTKYKLCDTHFFFFLDVPVLALQII